MYSVKHYLTKMIPLNNYVCIQCVDFEASNKLISMHKLPGIGTGENIICTVLTAFLRCQCVDCEVSNSL